jgi:hypothetical protein
VRQDHTLFFFDTQFYLDVTSPRIVEMVEGKLGASVRSGMTSSAHKKGGGTT